MYAAEREWWESGEDWRPAPLLPSYREVRRMLALEKQRSQALRRLVVYRLDKYLEEMVALDDRYRIELEERGLL
jgi:ribosomal protein L13